MEVEDGVDEAIRQAIQEAISAGIHWRASRFNTKTAATWAGFAQVHSDRAATLLAKAMDRLGVDNDPWPSSRGE